MRYKNFRLEQRHAVQTGRERHTVQNATDTRSSDWKRERHTVQNGTDTSSSDWKRDISSEWNRDIQFRLEERHMEQRHSSGWDSDM
jgi:hypothetical protein